VEIFNPSSPLHYSKNPEGLRSFLDYRADLVWRLQKEWIEKIESLRSRFPDLDLVLTQIDDRLDTTVHDLIGADAARLLKLLDKHDLTYMVEDPFMVWNTNPQRYTEIGKLYRSLTPHIEKLSIDINVVERYGDEIYPTSKQTGAELFELVHLASQTFSRVAIYAENTVTKYDRSLLPSALALVNRVEHKDNKFIIDSPLGVGVFWEGEASVDGQIWPVTDGNYLWLPSGVHTVEASSLRPHTRIIDFNGELKSASCLANGIEFSYQSNSRALAILDRKPLHVRIDGEDLMPELYNSNKTFTLVLPRGNHTIKVLTE